VLTSVFNLIWLILLQCIKICKTDIQTFYLDTWTTVLCEPCLTALAKNTLTYLLTYLLTYCLWQVFGTNQADTFWLPPVDNLITGKNARHVQTVIERGMERGVLLQCRDSNIVAYRLCKLVSLL